MDDPIKKYVLEARQNGFSDNQIRTTLVSVGWDAQKIDEALAVIPGGVSYDEDQVKHALNKWVKGLFFSQKLSLLITTGLSLIGVGITLLEPWPIKIIIDSVFGRAPAPNFLEDYERSIELIYYMGAAMVAIVVVHGIYSFVSVRINERLRYSLDQRIKSSFFSHILKLPLNYQAKLQSGDYVYRQNNETSELSDVIFDIPREVFHSLLLIGATFLVLLSFNLRIALLTIMVIPAIFFSSRFFAKKVQQKMNEVKHINDKTAQLTTESIKNARLVQTFGKEEYQVGKLLQIMHAGFQRSLGLKYWQQGGELSLAIFMVLGMFFVVIIGGKQTYNGKLYIGELLLLMAYSQILYRPLDTLIQSYEKFKKSYAVVGRIFEVLNDHAEIEHEDAKGYNIFEFNERIDFRNVVIFENEAPILRDVNFTIKKGQKIGFVGPSGGGKSAILNTLTKFTSYQGSITIDGIEVSDINKRALRSMVSMVNQNPELFSDTIYNNICYARHEEVYPPEVEEAARAASAHEYIMQLPQQYTTNVGEAGAFLETALLQRIAIARAFLRNTPLLVMDEPTAALDVKSEKEVIKNVFSLMKDRTVLLVAHKLSLLTQMDQVYVVEGGTVIDIAKYGGVDQYDAYLRAHELV